MPGGSGNAVHCSLLHQLGERFDDEVQCEEIFWEKKCVSVLDHLAHPMEYFMLYFGPWPFFLDWGHFYLFFFSGESRSLEYSEGGVTACWLYWMWNKGSQVCIKIIALNPRVRIQIQLGLGRQKNKQCWNNQIPVDFWSCMGIHPRGWHRKRGNVQLEKH